MPWTWRYEKADGTVISTDELREAIFASQGIDGLPLSKQALCVC